MPPCACTASTISYALASAHPCVSDARGSAHPYTRGFVHLRFRASVHPCHSFASPRLRAPAHPCTHASVTPLAWIAGSKMNVSGASTHFSRHPWSKMNVSNVPLIALWHFRTDLLYISIYFVELLVKNRRFRVMPTVETSFFDHSTPKNRKRAAA